MWGFVLRSLDPKSTLPYSTRPRPLRQGYKTFPARETQLLQPPPHPRGGEGGGLLCIPGTGV